jgi:hypothetical protein
MPVLYDKKQKRESRKEKLQMLEPADIDKIVARLAGLPVV